MVKFEFVVNQLSEENVKFLWGAIVAYVEGVGGSLAGFPRELTEKELETYYQQEFEDGE